MLRTGTKAIDFELKDQNGNNFRLSQHYPDKIIVLFFYPRDETSGCIKEVCSFRDHYEEFVAAGCEVVGISRDDAQSHIGFRSHYKLPFTLLSDPGNKIKKRYKANGDLFGLMPGRVTYIIDKTGTIIHSFSSLGQAEKHVELALKKVTGNQ